MKIEDVNLDIYYNINGQWHTKDFPSVGDGGAKHSKYKLGTVTNFFNVN